MLLFAHVGITIGIVKAYENVFYSESYRTRNHIDYRFIMIGTILPDLIDKPLVEIKYGLAHHDGRFIAHTFIFAALIFILGLTIYFRNGNRKILLLGLCSFLHQMMDAFIDYFVKHPIGILDKVVNTFNRKMGIAEMVGHGTHKTASYISSIYDYLLIPSVMICEVVGVLLLGYFGLVVVREYRVRDFFKWGRL